ncbi:MAG TPA: nitroreductase/quinone reductase family protein [Actinomycetota bacterium]|nr:nitroreductase/quinone reductase family protein [Actinomycetota bacterium]
MQTLTREPIVRSFEPTKGFRTSMRIGNAFMRPLLRSRLGARIDDLALLSFTGRKSGRLFTVPVGYHELDGEGVILTASGWRANLRGGADVDVVHKGRRIPMRAELIEEPREVARIYSALLRTVALSKAKLAIGLEVRGDRMPTVEEIEEAVGGRRAVVLLRPR